MKRFFVGSFAYVVAAVAVFNTSSVAKAEIDGLQIRFKGGCVEENLSGRCSIAIRASGFDFSTADRVTLYVSAGRNQPMRRMTNHWRQLNERGQTIANIKNVPGACFQVRTWTDRDDASVRFRQQGRYANSRRAARSAYDEFDTTDRRDGIDRSYSSRVSEGNNRDISSNVVCEPSQQMAGTSSPSCDSLGGF
jgi:hypothetical protein